VKVPFWGLGDRQVESHCEVAATWGTGELGDLRKGFMIKGEV